MKTEKNLFKIFWVVLGIWAIMVLGWGCQTIPAPKTPNQKLAYGYALVNSLTQETSNLYKLNKINRATALKAYNSLTIAKTVLDTATKYENNKATFTTYINQAFRLIEETSQLIGKPINIQPLQAGGK